MTSTRTDLPTLTLVEVLDAAGADHSRGGIFPEAHSFMLASAGAILYPSQANSERMLDAAGEVSAKYGVTVDAMVRLHNRALTRCNDMEWER